MIDYSKDPREELARQAQTTHSITALTQVLSIVRKGADMLKTISSYELDNLTSSELGAVRGASQSALDIFIKAANTATKSGVAVRFKANNSSLSGVLSKITGAAFSIKSLAGAKGNMTPQRIAEIERLYTFVAEHTNTVDLNLSSKLGINPQSMVLELKEQRKTLQEEIAKLSAAPVAGNVKLGSFKELGAAAISSGESVRERVQKKFSAISALEAKDEDLEEQQKALENRSLEQAVLDDQIKSNAFFLKKASDKLIKDVAEAKLGTKNNAVLLTGSVIIRGSLDERFFSNIKTLAGQYILSDQKIIAFHTPVQRYEAQAPIKVTAEEQEMIKELAAKLSDKFKTKTAQDKAKDSKTKKPSSNNDLMAALTPHQALDIINAKSAQSLEIVPLSVTGKSSPVLKKREIKNVSFLWVMPHGDIVKLASKKELQVKEISLP